MAKVTDNWLKPRQEGEDFPQDLHRHKNPRLVQVDWIDSTGFSGWRHEENWKDRDSNRCRTVGYLVSQDREALHLAASRDNVGNFNERQSIPKGCVKAIRQLEVKDAGQNNQNQRGQGAGEHPRRSQG